MKATLLFVIAVFIFGIMIGNGSWLGPQLIFMPAAIVFLLFLAYYYDGLFFDNG